MVKEVDNFRELRDIINTRKSVNVRYLLGSGDKRTELIMGRLIGAKTQTDDRIASPLEIRLYDEGEGLLMDVDGQDIAEENKGSYRGLRPREAHTEAPERECEPHDLGYLVVNLDGTGDEKLTLAQFYRAA